MYTRSVPTASTTWLSSNKELVGIENLGATTTIGWSDIAVLEIPGKYIIQDRDDAEPMESTTGSCTNSGIGQTMQYTPCANAVIFARSLGSIAPDFRSILAIRTI